MLDQAKGNSPDIVIMDGSQASSFLRDTLTTGGTASVVSLKYLYRSSLLLPYSGLRGSGLDLLHLNPRPVDFLHNFPYGGRPDEGLRLGVPGLHKFVNRLL